MGAHGKAGWATGEEEGEGGSCVHSLRGHPSRQECWSVASTRLFLTSQFFAIMEANYPETVKNILIVRGED